MYCIYACMYVCILVVITPTVSEKSQQDPSRIPSVQEKMQLTYDVFRLSNAEMTELLEMVQKECSAAIAHSMHAEEVHTLLYIHTFIYT